MKIQSWISVVSLVICLFLFGSLSRQIKKIKRIDIKNKYDVNIKIDNIKAAGGGTITIKLDDAIIDSPSFYYANDTTVYGTIEFKNDSI
jgi:hypothetical protein